ncbi:MAG: hypothetical protein EBU08_17400 [Micrococcales bacterium]|nr:hypothetical protein [Micrococcales bacterium]
MGLFTMFSTSLRGGAMAANALKIIVRLTGEQLSEFAIEGLKEQGMRGGWRNAEELALLNLRRVFEEPWLKNEDTREYDIATKTRILSFFESCKSQNLLGDYIISEYEGYKDKM